MVADLHSSGRKMQAIAPTGQGAPGPLQRLEILACRLSEAAAVVQRRFLHSDEALFCNAGFEVPV
jgi:hypothetical protein